MTAFQIGYGAGPHSCVAQMMARLEAEVFFRAFARKVQDIEIVGTPTLRLNPGLRGLSSYCRCDYDAQAELKGRAQTWPM